MLGGYQFPLQQTLLGLLHKTPPHTHAHPVGLKWEISCPSPATKRRGRLREQDAVALSTVPLSESDYVLTYREQTVEMPERELMYFPTEVLP